MNIYRYNPVFNQWVLLGAHSLTDIDITDRHLLDIGKTQHFVAATIPRQPFIMDPPEKRAQVADDLLYQSQPPVGEAETMLYTGEFSLSEWEIREWDAWLMLIQQRIMQVYQNPYVHFVKFSFSTAMQRTAGPAYLRVGDLISTSHPIAGSQVVLQTELVAKLRAKERAFIILNNDAGDLYVPSAPLFEKEVWFLPKRTQPTFEKISKDERQDIARLMRTLFRSLHTEYHGQDFVFTLHTSLNEMSEESTWWMQITQQEVNTLSSYPVRPLPEAFARRLEFALGGHK